VYPGVFLPAQGEARKQALAARVARRFDNSTAVWESGHLGRPAAVLPSATSAGAPAPPALPSAAWAAGAGPCDGPADAAGCRTDAHDRVEGDGGESGGGGSPAAGGGPAVDGMPEPEAGAPGDSGAVPPHLGPGAPLMESPSCTLLPPRSTRGVKRERDGAAPARAPVVAPPSLAGTGATPLSHVPPQVIPKRPKAPGKVLLPARQSQAALARQQQGLFGQASPQASGTLPPTLSSPAWALDPPKVTVIGPSATPKRVVHAPPRRRECLV
jgi:hypothetical protein